MTMVWSAKNISELLNQPLIDLLIQAQSIHRQYFQANEIELCTLLSIKTGGCPENCAYCPQSAHFDTGITKEKLLPLDIVIEKAKFAKAQGATRFCMGAAWRGPSQKNLKEVIEMISAVKKVGLETCVTLGMLNQDQAKELKKAGLDFYNHNIDTSADYYSTIITTHTHADRLQTLSHAQEAGLRICCGGILGMGETREDRISFLLQLTQLPSPPESVPLNRLIRIPGTPLAKEKDIEEIEFIRIVAATRILLPGSMIRLSAGRSLMTQTMQILCFMAGANSMWLGDKLLTTTNNPQKEDRKMLADIGLVAKMMAAN